MLPKKQQSIEVSKKDYDPSRFKGTPKKIIIFLSPWTTPTHQIALNSHSHDVLTYDGLDLEKSERKLSVSAKVPETFDLLLGEL